MKYELNELTNSTNVIKIKSRKQKARSKKKSYILLLITSCILLLTSCFLFVENVNAKECSLIEPEVLKKAIKNKSIYDMVILDVAPKYDIDGRRKFDLRTNRRRIPSSIWAPLEDIKREFTGKVDELIDKYVILVGEDTESAENVCKYMMKKDYGARNIYVLKGGMEKWDGPVKEDFTKVECKMITSRELINMIKSDRKIEIIDKRPENEYHEAHIPGAGSERDATAMDRPLIRFLLKKREWRIRRARENITLIYVYDNEFHAMRDCRYEKYFGHPGWHPEATETSTKENIYVLRGGMKAWEGDVERDYLEILKKKVKEKLK